MAGVPEDLTNCSVQDFIKLFTSLLQQAKSDALDLDQIYGDDTLEQVKLIVHRAVDAYHSCMAGKWHIATSLFLEL